MTLAATLLYGGLVGALWTALSANVSRVRLTLRLSGPPTDNPELYRAARAHGNLAESAPLALLLLAVCELSQAPSTWVHALGGTYLAARLLHAASWFIRARVLRMLGATFSVVTMGALAALALFLHFR